MSDRIAEVILIAEDRRSANLLYRYLKKAIDPRAIRPVLAPAGLQSADDWVIQHYAQEVREQRRRVAHGRNLAALVVHVDADVGSVLERMSELAAALSDAGQAPRGGPERIVIAVPRRHTETWVHGLCAVQVDEEYDFKRDPGNRIASNRQQRERLTDQRVGPAAGELYQLTRPNAAEPGAVARARWSPLRRIRRRCPPRGDVV